MDIWPPGLGIGQQEAGSSSENPLTFNFADPVAGTDGSLYPGENVQILDTEVSYLYSSFTHSLLNQVLQVVQSPTHAPISPFEQQLILPGEPVGHCKWKDEYGTVCEEAITRGTLPGHLSEHGIKNKSRNHPTKCNWVGCKTKKPMNRESIVRHIREVHLRLRRPSKGVFKALVHRPSHDSVSFSMITKHSIYPDLQAT